MEPSRADRTGSKGREPQNGGATRAPGLSAATPPALGKGRVRGSSAYELPSSHDVGVGIYIGVEPQPCSIPVPIAIPTPRAGLARGS